MIPFVRGFAAWAFLCMLGTGSPALDPGRLFMAGEKSELEKARDHIVKMLKGMSGRKV